MSAAQSTRSLAADVFERHRAGMASTAEVFGTEAHRFAFDWCHRVLVAPDDGAAPVFRRAWVAVDSALAAELGRRTLWAHPHPVEDAGAWRPERYQAVETGTFGMPYELARVVRVAFGSALPVMGAVDRHDGAIEEADWSVVWWRGRSRPAYVARLAWPRDLEVAAGEYRSHFEVCASVRQRLLSAQGG